jgi:hypothetical protein
MLKSTRQTWGRTVDSVMVNCEDDHDLYPRAVVSKCSAWTSNQPFARLYDRFSSLFSPAKYPFFHLLKSVLYSVSTPPITTTTFLLINNYSFSN